MANSGSKSVTVTSWDTLKFSWSENGQSIANNTTTINWKLELISGSSGRIDSSAEKSWSVVVDGQTFSGKNTVGIANNTTKTLASGSKVITHDSNGKKTFSYSFSQQFSITFSGVSIGTKSGSGSGTLTDIKRASVLNASNGTLDTAQTLSVTRYDSSFTHTIKYECGSYSGTIVEKSSSTSISWTPPVKFANGAPNGTSVYIALTIETYSGSTLIGTSQKAITCNIPDSVKPTVSVAVSDPTGYKDTYGIYIQGISKLKIDITASGSYGSTIKTRKTTVDGKAYTESSITTDVISGSGSLTLNVTVTDSRGRTASTSSTISVLAYAMPKITSLSVKRCNADGSSSSSGAYLSVIFSASMTALNNKNSASYTIKYKKANESTYTTETLTDFAGQYSVSDGVFIFSASTSSSYDIILTATDSFNSVTKTSSGSSIKKLWSALKRGFGFAFGKVAELENVLDIAFQIYPRNGFINCLIPEGTDLNTIINPNVYKSKNAGNAGYLNVPIETGTFTLEVESAGDEGQILQRLIYCSKDKMRTFYRFYYSDSWGEWLEPDYDSGWIELTLNDGWSYQYSSDVPSYRKVGKTVYLRGLVNATSDAGNIIATLPEGFRPHGSFDRFVCVLNQNENVNIQVNYAGVINDYNKGSATRTFICLDAISYPTIK